MYGGAFSNKSGLVSVRFPAGLTRIGYNAFFSCISLSSLELPSALDFIETLAFYGCSSLAAVHVHAITPPGLGA
ncbi:MAG: leucine-rich repeat domain-containing protein, partial [Tannerellaceae bacterium]|nr:leucine-rich repeat domain-containing protein [Tannerellaceae bacterium]